MSRNTKYIVLVFGAKYIQCTMFNSQYPLSLSIPLTHLIAYLLVYRDENRLHTDTNKCISLTMNVQSIRAFSLIQNEHFTFHFKRNYIDGENVQFSTENAIRII